MYCTQEPAARVQNLNLEKQNIKIGKECKELASQIATVMEYKHSAVQQKSQNRKYTISGNQICSTPL